MSWAGKIADVHPRATGRSPLLQPGRRPRSIRFTVVLAGALLVALLPPAAWSATLHVPSEFLTIQAAIDAAVDGDTVQVAPGTFLENINFGGKAITVESEQGPDVTIIDGNQADSVVTFASGEGPGAVLEGFTIRNGQANEGGGIHIQGSSPTIRGNIVTTNRACDGAGIGVGFGSPVIEQNVITGNQRSGCTGGIGGGGIVVRGNSSTQILENTISNNSTGASGGGIALFAAGTVTIIGNTITGNTALEGGGISKVNLADGVIVQNLIAANQGGGIYWVGGGSLQLGNTTIADNPQGSGLYLEGLGLPPQVELANNIIVAAAGEDALLCGQFGDPAAGDVRFNDIFAPSGSAYAGMCTDRTGQDGNISADPLFGNPANGDYTLDFASPAIDTGDNTAPGLPPTDLNGDPRPADGNGDGDAVVDMGAFELSGHPPGVIQFGATSYVVSESGGSVVISAVRLGGRTGRVTVDYATSDGTATAGSDYTSTSGTLVFADGEFSKSFTVQITEDTVPEADETVNLTLSNPTGGATLGARRTAVLTITDADLINAAEYFPWQPGTMWTYEQNGGARFTTRVLDRLVPVNGALTAVFADSPSGAQAFYSVDAAGVLLHRLFQRGVLIPGLGRVNLTLTFDPPVRLVEALTDIGRTSNSNGVVEVAVGSRRVPLAYGASFTVEGLDRVTVPAGTFDVVRLQGTITIEGDPLAFTFDLARGIGVVRAVADDLEGSRSTSELISTNADVHDLAVTRIIAPRRVTLTARMPARTVLVKVLIQNRSPHSETIRDLAMLGNLVTLTVESLGACAAPAPVLVPPSKPFPLTLKPKQTLTLGFAVTFDCANDPAASTPRDPAHWDYRYMARVDHSALDGTVDTHVQDDVCPRPPLGLDPNPDGTIRDPGCGERNPDRTLGADVLTDVITR